MKVEILVRKMEQRFKGGLAAVREALGILEASKRLRQLIVPLSKLAIKPSGFNNCK